MLVVELFRNLAYFKEPKILLNVGKDVVVMPEDLENVESRIEDFFTKYYTDESFKGSGEEDVQGRLLKSMLDKSLLLFVLLCKQIEIMRTDPSKRALDIKPFSKFDKYVFKNQLIKLWDKLSQNTTYTSLDQNSEFKLVNGCVYKELQEKLDRVDQIFNIKESADDKRIKTKKRDWIVGVRSLINNVQRYLKVYKQSGHFRALTGRDLRRRGFFKKFSETIKKFQTWTDNILRELDLGEVRDDLHPEDLLFTEKVYDKKGMEGKSSEEQLKHAKDIILHAYVCYIGACKYACLKDVNIKEEIAKTKSSLNLLEWDKGFVKSLKYGDDKKWREGLPEILELNVDEFINKISELTTLDGLYNLFDKASDREMVLEKCIDEELLRPVVIKFRKWVRNLKGQLKRQVEIVPIWEKKAKEIETFDEYVENERLKVLRKLDSKVDDELRAARAGLTHDESGGKLSLTRIAQKADDGYEVLKKKGVILDDDDTEALGGIHSEKFVKLFIRYIERSFAELRDNVKIYYSKYDFSTSTENEYWLKIRYLRHKSKTDGKIYFVVNQAGGSDWAGHANLTVVCCGHFKIFESVGGSNTSNAVGKNHIGKQDYHEVGAGIQRDTANCVTISLGYLESMVKKILRNKESWSSAGKNIAECFWNDISRFTDVKSLPCDPRGSKVFPVNCLVPTEYVKYLQSRSGIDKFIAYVEQLSESSEDYTVLKEVADKLRETIQRYDLFQQPFELFWRDVSNIGDRHYKRNMDLGGPYLSELHDIVKKTKTDQEITVQDLVDDINNRELTLDSFYKKIIDFKEKNNEEYIRLVKADGDKKEDEKLEESDGEDGDNDWVDDDSFDDDLRPQNVTGGAMRTERVSPEDLVDYVPQTESASSEEDDYEDKRKKLSACIKRTETLVETVKSIIFDEGARNQLEEWLKRELQKPVYKINDCDNPIEEMTLKDLEKLDSIYSDVLYGLPIINNRTRMKRRTEIIKVASLVKALGDKVSPDDEVKAVRTFLQHRRRCSYY